MDWKDTVLWKKLQNSKSPEKAAVITTLESCMPLIQKILNQGGTAQTDFTLHDGDHSGRVAQRMVEIMPADTVNGLTPYELALLLLAAYLHDIGMTPELKKVRSHYQYAVTGVTEGLTQDDVDEFQKWLDDEGEGGTPPIDTSTPHGLDLSYRIITHYSRHRHNDWSEEWIRKHLGKFELAGDGVPELVDI